jgi:hypothetical protein
MNRGRPMTPTPSDSTERSRKSRERAARKARKEKIIDHHIRLYRWQFVRTNGRKLDTRAELRRRRRKK